jgi:MFS superfamily sulfate permease-like transporter
LRGSIQFGLNSSILPPVAYAIFGTSRQLTGLFCIAASYFPLGALVDFLSKPILVRFLNGVAISIFLGQIGKLLGFSVESSGIIL